MRFLIVQLLISVVVQEDISQSRHDVIETVSRSEEEVFHPRRNTSRGHRSAPSRRVHYEKKYEYDYDNYVEEELPVDEMFDQCTMMDVFTLKTNKQGSDEDWIADLNIENAETTES